MPIIWKIRLHKHFFFSCFIPHYDFLPPPLPQTSTQPTSLYFILLPLCSLLSFYFSPLLSQVILDSWNNISVRNTLGGCAILVDSSLYISNYDAKSFVSRVVFFFLSLFFFFDKINAYTLLLVKRLLIPKYENFSLITATFTLCMKIIINIINQYSTKIELL